MNDFSFAPANGIEATFSRNVFIRNYVEDRVRDVGRVQLRLADRRQPFPRQPHGIAIEHGQSNVIVANIFVDDSTGIRVWGDSIEPSIGDIPSIATPTARLSIDGNLFGRRGWRAGCEHQRPERYQQSFSERRLRHGAAGLERVFVQR